MTATKKMTIDEVRKMRPELDSTPKVVLTRKRTPMSIEAVREKTGMTIEGGPKTGKVAKVHKADEPAHVTPKAKADAPAHVTPKAKADAPPPPKSKKGK
jgi:hypothetical protein